jgi:putative endonuclease
MKKSMAEHNELGKIGEDEAIAYLKSKGYSILYRNWRSGKFELDIIAENEEYLVVVEVKSRKEGYLLHPIDSVGKSKMRNIILAAEKYIFANDVQKETRFDIISVVVQPQGKFCIEHIEDAFLP